MDKAFSIVKIVSKGSNYFPGKKYKLIIFHLKCTKPKKNCIVCIAEHQTLKMIPQICLIFQFTGVWITSLAHAKGLFKIIFGLIILLVNGF